jgi:hypothetical protein
MSDDSNMRLYHSEEDLRERLVREVIFVASNAGFDTSEIEEDTKRTLLGKGGSDEQITVFPDGSWMYEGPASRYMTGQSAAQLGLFLSNPEQYIDIMDED